MLNISIPAIGGGLRLGFFMGDKEVGRINSTALPPHQLAWPIETFQERETDHRRPWYCEEIEVKIYDDMSSSSISSQLKSTYSRMKSAVNKQREGANVEPVNEHNHVAAIRLPLRDAHWSREAQDTMTKKRRDLRGPGQEALRGGKWYKIVPSNPDDKQGRFSGEYLFVLISLTVHGSDHEEESTARDSIVSLDAISRLTPPAPNMLLRDICPPSSPYFRHLYISFESMEKQVQRSSSGIHGVGATMSGNAHVNHVPLVGPTHGEEVLDLRENVQWRVAAGSNSFGDTTYILAKGLLIITDLRVLFIPLFIISSMWPHGAVLVPLEHLGVSVCASLRGKGNRAGKTLHPRFNDDDDEAEASPGTLSSVKRYTFSLPLPCVLESRCQASPSTASSIKRMGGAAAGEGGAGGGSSAVGAATGTTTTTAGPLGQQDELSSSDKEALAGARSFLAQAEREYGEYVTAAAQVASSTRAFLSASPSTASLNGTGAGSGRCSNADVGIGGSGSGSDGRLRTWSAADDPVRDTRATSNSSNADGQDSTVLNAAQLQLASKRHNIVFVSKDGTTTEFTVPCVEYGKEVIVPGLSAFMDDSDDDYEDDDDDDHDDGDGDEAGGASGNGQGLGQSPAGRGTSKPSSIPPSAPQSLSLSLSLDRLAKRLYRGGLSSQQVRPGTWCARVRDLCMWQASLDSSWARFALHLRTSVEHHIHALEAMAFREGAGGAGMEEEEDDDDGSESDSSSGSGSGSSSSGSSDSDSEGEGEESGGRGLVGTRQGASSLVSPSSSSSAAPPYERSLQQLRRCLSTLAVEQDLQRLRVQDAGWRVSDLNHNYALCDTYPHTLCFPETLSDEDVEAAAAQRSRNRLPAMVWLHPFNKAAMVRSAQPFTGVSGNTKNTEHDVRLCLAIRDLSLVGFTPANEDDHQESYHSGGRASRKPPLRIADARPRLNANANALQGKGFESISQFGGAANATLLFMDIENIHVMRGSISRLREGIAHTGWGWTTVTGGGAGASSQAAAARAASAYSSGSSSTVGVGVEGKMDTEVMHQSSWKTHLSLLLKGAVGVAESLVLGHSVLIHCSDGWDRTAQLTSLGQILLDPHYRSTEGFLMLLEKEWCAFGHRMESRLNQKSKRLGNPRLPSKDDLSPVLLQYLDCVWQLHRQYPAAFEFSQHFLVVLSHAAQSGLFLSFRENCERERGELLRKAVDKMNIPREHLFYSSFAVYARLLLYCPSNREQLINPLYVPPSPQHSKLQYLRPRCSGPHDLELWREGLCGFLDSSLGVLHEPACELLGVEEWQVRLLRTAVAEARSTGAGAGAGAGGDVSRWMREHVVGGLVEGAVDMGIRFLCLEQRAQRHLKESGTSPPPTPPAPYPGSSPHSHVHHHQPQGRERGQEHPPLPSAALPPPPVVGTPVRKGTPIGGPGSGARRRPSSARSKGAKAKEKAKSAFASLKRLGGF